MFSEILKIIPRLDPSATRNMENTLSRRFGRVARRFGAGLRAAVNGTIIGISLGLLAKILNPIREIEERIKTMLGLGVDAQEMAERFGASPGELRQIQDVARSLRVSPEQLEKMMMGFATAVENAREELADPTKMPSARTLAVRQFIDSENLAQSFKEFLAALRAEGMGEGREITLESGIIRRLTGEESRQFFEREVFGDMLFGGARKLVEVDLDKEIGKLGLATDRFTEAINKLATIEDARRAEEIQRETRNIIESADAITPRMVQQIEEGERRLQERQVNELQAFQDLKAAANALGIIQDWVVKIQILIGRGLKHLERVVAFIDEIKNSRWIRGILGRR